MARIEDNKIANDQDMVSDPIKFANIHKVFEEEVKHHIDHAAKNVGTDNVDSILSQFPTGKPRDNLTSRQHRTKISDIGIEDVAIAHDQDINSDPIEIPVSIKPHKAYEIEVKPEVDDGAGNDIDCSDFIHSVLSSDPHTLRQSSLTSATMVSKPIDSGLADIHPKGYETQVEPEVDNAKKSKDQEYVDSIPCVFPTCRVRDPLPSRQGRIQSTGVPYSRLEFTRNGNENDTIPEPTDIGSPGINLRIYHLSTKLRIDHGSQTPQQIPNAISGTKELVKVGSSFCDIVSSTEKSIQVEL